MSRVRGLSVAVLVLALVATACGSSGNNSSDNGGGSGQPDLVADKRAALQAVLRAGDLSDYKANLHSTGSEIPTAVKRNFAQCMGTPTTVFDTVPRAQTADSPDFSKGRQNEQQVTSSVEIDPTRADTDAGWNSFASKKTEGCLAQLFRDFLSGPVVKQFKLGPVQVTPFTVGVGDRSTGYAMSRSATGPVQTIQIDVDVIYAVRDRAGMEFHFFNYGTTPDREAEKQLVQKVYDRIGNKAA